MAAGKSNRIDYDVLYRIYFHLKIVQRMIFKQHKNRFINNESNSAPRSPERRLRPEHQGITLNGILVPKVISNKEHTIMKQPLVQHECSIT